MISVEQARESILSRVSPLSPIRVPLLDGLGLTLAEDITASFSIPPYSNSAMDGYAVRSVDTRGAAMGSPVSLEVIAELPAGVAPSVAVREGSAIRIMTGAPVPPGADAIVQFELTGEDRGEDKTDRVAILAEAKPGQNIRESGEDILAGSIVFSAGTELRPSEIGVIASLGLAEVTVTRRPRIAILSTGDELLSPGEPLREGMIYDANLYSVAALVKRYGGEPLLLGIARDNVDDLVAKVRAGLEADLFISSAGVSMGDYDVVKEVLAREGEIGFWQVAMKPGRPLAFGEIKGVPFVGLPGNPVASMIAFEQFIRPAILKMLGKKHLEKPQVETVLVGEAKNGDARRCFLRAFVSKRETLDGQSEYVATLTGPQGSGILSSMAQANGLVVIPENVPSVRTGDRVITQMLDWPEVE